MAEHGGGFLVDHFRLRRRRREEIHLGSHANVVICCDASALTMILCSAEVLEHLLLLRTVAGAQQHDHQQYECGNRKCKNAGRTDNNHVRSPKLRAFTKRRPTTDAFRSMRRSSPRKLEEEAFCRFVY